MSERMTVEEARAVTGWAAMPAWILYTPEIPASAKFVAMLVYNDEGEAPIYYAEAYDISEQNVRDALNALVAIGILEVRDGLPYPAPVIVGLEGVTE